MENALETEKKRRHCENVKRWRLRNPDKAREAVRKWQKKNPERVRENAKNWRSNWTQEQRDRYLKVHRERTFRRRYGIGPETYEKLLIDQCGQCALCPRTPSEERYGRLNVDHCHETGRIRGLLCTPCNHALGVLGDNKAGLQVALDYVGRG